jgi:predicted Zn-dependent peptidase
MIVTVSGDVDPEKILAKIDSYLRDWPGEGTRAEWPPPQPTHQPRPGAYHVEKDIPQGTVFLGHPVPRWTDWGNPDRAALQVMDHILGGAGFTSRITKRIRSDEGLAYDASSSFGFDALGPGSFTVSFQSKNGTVALAAKIALEEIARIRTEPASEEEIAIAKASLIETFPRRFESAAQIAGIYAGDAFIGRSHDYWKNWRPQVEEVTADDVLRVAREYLKPEAIVFLVVGKWEEIAPGDADGRASMKELFGGEVTHLPLRDPLTLKALP